MKRNDWTFDYTAARLAEAAQAKIAHHEARLAILAEHAFVAFCVEKLVAQADRAPLVIVEKGVERPFAVKALDS